MAIRYMVIHEFHGDKYTQIRGYFEEEETLTFPIRDQWIGDMTEEQYNAYHEAFCKIINNELPKILEEAKRRIEGRIYDGGRMTWYENESYLMNKRAVAAGYKALGYIWDSKKRDYVRIS